MARHIYFIPGMGTTKEVFKNIDLHVDNIHYLEFPEPEKEETLKEYSQRMALPISDENENILIGMSMGGFIAQEISLLKKVDKLILISSYTQGQRLANYARNSKEIQPYRIDGGSRLQGHCLGRIGFNARI